MTNPACVVYFQSSHRPQTAKTFIWTKRVVLPPIPQREPNSSQKRTLCTKDAQKVSFCALLGAAVFLLGWHVCRTKLARKIVFFFRGTNFLTKMLHKFPQYFWAFFKFVGPKFPPKFTPKIKQIHQRASAGAQGESFWNRWKPHFLCNKNVFVVWALWLDWKYIRLVAMSNVRLREQYPSGHKFGKLWGASSAFLEETLHLGDCERFI